MYFHTDNDQTIARLAEAIALATTRGRIRFDVDSRGRLKYKVGGGMWSEPISSTPDPWRDQH